MSLNDHIKKRNEKISCNLVIVLLFGTTLLGAYKFATIGTYSVTVFTIFGALIIVWGIVRFERVIDSIKRNPYSLVMSLYVVLNFFITQSEELFSMLLVLFCFFVFICSYALVSQAEFQKIVRRYQCLLTVLAVYGILQIPGRMLGIPIFDLYFEGFMVPGYNWSNPTRFGDIQIDRSNAIFLEPSFYAQFMALNSLLYVGRLAKTKTGSKEAGRIWGLFTVNMCATLCAFSGTGILVFLLGLAGAIVFVKDIRKRLFEISGYIICALSLLGLFVIIQDALTNKSSLIEYAARRIGEIFVLQTGNTSGYVRFNEPIAILTTSLAEAPIFGQGIGKIAFFSQGASSLVTGYVSNGLVRVGVELGLVGILFFVAFMLRCFKNTTFHRNPIWLIMISASIMCFCQETLTSVYFWILICLAGLQIEKVGKEKS